MEYNLKAIKNVEIEYLTVIEANSLDEALDEFENKLSFAPTEIDIDKASSLKINYTNNNWWELEENYDV